MDPPNSRDLALLARQLDLPVESVETVSNFLDSGHTCHFIARYRRDEVGGLKPLQIGKIKRRLDRRRQLEARKEAILKAIATRGRLTDELKQQIRDTHSAKVLEDRYLPFKSKKKGAVDDARQENLSPLADLILSAEDSRSVEELASTFVDADQGIEAVQDAIDGARELIEERFNLDTDLRKTLRRTIRRTGVLTTKRNDDTTVSDDDEGNTVASGGQDATTANPKEAALDPTRTEETRTAEQTPPDSTESQSKSTDPDSNGGDAKTDSQGQQPDPGASSQEETPTNADAANSNTSDGEAPKASAPEVSDSATSLSETVQPESTNPPDAGSLDNSQADATAGDNSSAEPPSVKATLDDSAKPGESAAASNATNRVKSTKRTSRVTAAGVALSKEARRQLRREARHRKRKRLESSFQEFFDFREPMSKVHEHRILAIDRGERFRVLEVKVSVDETAIFEESRQILVPPEHPRTEFLTECLKSALERRILSSLERDIRAELTDRAEQHAIRAFSTNLKRLLLRCPFSARVFAISSSHRMGCHIAVLDHDGTVLEHKQLHLLANDERKKTDHTEALDMIRRHSVSIIAIGSGKGSREIERLAGDWIQNELSGSDVHYSVVNASGANRYATSVLACEELPDLTPGTREATVIGRRFLDPLAEFVKIEPGAVDVGAYPEEMKAKPIQRTLQAVVFDCVNETGVNLNTANKSLLRNVSGLNHLTAQRIYEHREKNGPFRSRSELANVAGLSDEARSQAVGFLKILGGDDPLDATRIHPDHYSIAEKILEKGGSSISDLRAYLAAVAAAAAPQPLRSDSAGTEYQSGQATPAAPSEDSPRTAPESSGEIGPNQMEPGESDSVPKTDAIAPGSGAPDPSSSDSESNASTSTSAMPSTEKQSAKQSAEKPAPSIEKPKWDFADKAQELDAEALAQELGAGRHLIASILSELAMPSHDIRLENSGPTLRKGTISFKSLKPGMVIDGTVSNVVDFGVFVDIGLKDAGLVHISRMADHFVPDPSELYSVGQSLRVWIVDVDPKKRRIALTAIEPGTEKERSPSPKTRRQRPKKRGGQPPATKGGRGGKPRTFKSKPRRPKTPVKPITDGMIEGKEPMRTFSDLLQFADTKRKPDKEKP